MTTSCRYGDSEDLGLDDASAPFSWTVVHQIATDHLDLIRPQARADKLKVIATELVTPVRKNVTIDWTLRESARAKIRVIVRGNLRKHGYPPDL